MERGRGTCKCGSRREGEANKEVEGRIYMENMCIAHKHCTCIIQYTHTCIHTCNVLNHVCI